MSDNYRLDVVGDRKEVFDAAIRLAFLTASSYNEAKAKSYVIKNNSLILIYYGDDKETTKFPMELSVDTAISFCWEWLQQQKYDQQPDYDGSNKKGFWITTTDVESYNETNIWYTPGGFHGGILKLTPTWSMYGK